MIKPSCVCLKNAVKPIHHSSIYPSIGEADFSYLN